jgi:beta-glucosidase
LKPLHRDQLSYTNNYLLNFHPPKDFQWGVGISAYQTEGHTLNDGRGPSIWDVFPNSKIKGGKTAATSCNFYENYINDIALTRWLGVQNFKTSISWSRILPEGKGAINSRGIGFYDRLIDELLSKQINPWIVLYHWDLPQALQDKGGWVNRDTVFHFLDYLTICEKHFGDRIKNWIVFNEPFVFVGAGYFLGIHAPGEIGLRSFLPATHHVNLANSLGINHLQNISAAKVGSSFSFASIHAISKTTPHQNAQKRFHNLVNHLFLDPVIGKGYPFEHLPFLKKIDRFMEADDPDRMHCTPDFLGVQVYTREVIRNSWFMPYLRAKVVTAEQRGAYVTSLGQEVYPMALMEVLNWLIPHIADKNIPLYITECGISQPEKLVKHPVKDHYRVLYYTQVLNSIRRYVASGDVRGLFFWSLMDNFEWAEGFTSPFGLFHVDFETLERNPKKSAHWVRQLMKEVATG